MSDVPIGAGIGVPNRSSNLYDPYPLSPASVPGWRAKPESTESGILVARGVLPNPGGRNLLIRQGVGVLAMDLVGIIFHNERDIEVTSSPMEAVKDGKFVRGEGGIILADEEHITLLAIATRRFWRAEDLRARGAAVSEITPGHFIARIMPQLYAITDKSAAFKTVQATKVGQGW